MKAFVFACLYVLQVWSVTVEAADVTHIGIATGNETGVYFPAGGSICRLVNKNSKENGFRCLVESTEGSPYNLRALRAGEVDFGIVQSDWQYHAYHGSSIFEQDGPHTELRSVFAIHAEAFSVVARSDANIRSFNDLKGKRVSIGSAESGQRSTLNVLMSAFGWTKGDFKAAVEIKAIEQPRALCANEIDVMLYMVGHPSGAVKEVTTLCDSVLVPVTGVKIDNLIKANSYYRKTTIPAGMYRSTDQAVETFGVGATFVTVKDTPDRVVYAVVKAVFENFDLFRRSHPALANLKKEEMIMGSLTAPLHPGAEKYYREVGLLNQ